jgi:hypothetical protein
MLCTLLVNTIVAQGTLPSPFYTSRLTDFWSWSADSQVFVFIDFGARTTNELPDIYNEITFAEELWYSYDIVGNTISSNITWPLQPPLSDIQYQQMSVFGGSTQPTLVFPSPNNNLFAYMIGGIGSLPVPGGISDGQIMVRADNALFDNPRTEPNFYQILWNETGTAIVTYNSSPAATYVSFANNFIVGTSLTQPTSTNLFQSQPSRGIRIESFQQIAPIYDVANETPEVLLLANEEGSLIGVDEQLPVIWNALHPNASEFIDSLKNQGVIAGVFAPNNESQILFVDATGLVSYDRINGQIQLLSNLFTSQTVARALFSPDGHWLVIDIAGNLYLIDVVSYLP